MIQYDNFLYKYIRFFGVLSIVVGIFWGVGEIQRFSDPDYSIMINGIERSDAEAKFLALIMPIILIVAGGLMNFITREDVRNVQKAKRISRSIFEWF